MRFAQCLSALGEVPKNSILTNYTFFAYNMGVKRNE